MHNTKREHWPVDRELWGLVVPTMPALIGLRLSLDTVFASVQPDYPQNLSESAFCNRRFDLQQGMASIGGHMNSSHCWLVL